MPATPSLNCLHCNRLFVPDCRHRDNQKYCMKPACRQARQAANLQRWREKPENKDFWRGSWNGDRVREWRAAHPGYGKRAGRKKKVPLQIASNAPEVAGSEQDKPESGGAGVTNRIPALLLEQSPVVVGLIAQMTGSTLQNAILEVTARLFEQGRAVIGSPPSQPNENRKKNALSPAAAAHAAEL